MNQVGVLCHHRKLSRSTQGPGGVPDGGPLGLPPGGSDGGSEKRIAASGEALTAALEGNPVLHAHQLRRAKNTRD